MKGEGLENRPEDVLQLQGDAARHTFINHFKEIQRTKTQLNQYTELTEEQHKEIEETLSSDTHRAFRGVYIDIAKILRPPNTGGGGGAPDPHSQTEAEQLDFELALFADADIDYDYIMRLLEKDSHLTPDKQKRNREQILAMLAADAKFIDEMEDLREYIYRLQLGEAMTKYKLYTGFDRFKDEKKTRVLTELAA